MSEYIVYTEIHHDQGETERWYYGTYTREKANEVAIELGNNYPIYHCVCEEKDAEKFGILNMPRK